MKKITLDSIVLFALVTPFIMTYRISPGETPYWLFGLIFFGLFTYILLDIMRLSEKLYFHLKQVVLWLLIIGVIGSAFVSAIIVRHQTAPVYMIHDIVLQQEAAIRFFLDGKNPYGMTYFGTPLEEWNYSQTEVNPALYHFVMEPFYLLFSLPFYGFSNMFLGYFDGRIPLLFLFLSLLVTAAVVVKDQRKRLLFLALLAFHPAILPYTLEGRSDVFMFSFLFFGFFLLYKKQYALSGIPIGLAFAVKQSVWPIFPFYLAFLFFNLKKIKKVAMALLPFVITLGFVIVPFFLWDQKAFIESTVGYLAGSTQHSYPISGYGFGKFLNELGVIKDLNSYYPFIIWQTILGLPIVLFMIKHLKRHPTVNNLIFVYGIFLFVFWYFSRYFNNSHLAFISLVFIAAYFFPENSEEI